MFRNVENAEGLADAIIKYRAKHDLSQGEFAGRCGISKQTVGYIEAGRRQGVTALTRAKILQVIEEHEKKE